MSEALVLRALTRAVMMRCGGAEKFFNAYIKSACQACPCHESVMPLHYGYILALSF